MSVFILGWTIVWIAGPPFEPDPESICETQLREGASYDIRPAVLPPGASKCTVSTVEGGRHEELYIPWIEWLSIALVAAGTGLGVAAVENANHRGLLAYGCLSLTVSGLVAWFVGSVTALALVILTITMAVVFELLGTRKPPDSGGSPAH